LEVKLGIVKTIATISFFVTLLFSFFLLTKKTRSSLPNFFFGLFLLFIAFDISAFFWGSFYEKRVVLNSFKMATSLLQMPIFYLYVLSICYSDFRAQKKHLWHGVLFMIFMILLIVYSYSTKILLIFGACAEMQWLLYIILIFMSLNKHSQVYKENYSKPLPKVQNWLKQLTIIMVIAHSFVLARWVQLFFDIKSNMIYSDLIISINSLIITAWVLLSALYQPQLFLGIKSNQEPLKSKKKENILSDKTRTYYRQISNRLKLHMDLEKPYLDFELTLEKLAKSINVPEKELSLVINCYLNQHFFDFINQYRIAEAKSILSNPKREKETILEILYTVGFNSKSSFYTAFKKITGKTPKAYRKEKLGLE
jgi:AraC-like DNA-binding protein